MPQIDKLSNWKFNCPNCEYIGTPLYGHIGNIQCVSCKKEFGVNKMIEEDNLELIN